MTKDQEAVGIDFIGDVHGHASALEGLLVKLGYEREGEGWRHEFRTAVFVGDLIDRGPEQRRTVELVRAMVERRAAKCLMGNHEFNAIAWLTPNPRRPGEYLRAHNSKHHHQHKAFLDAVEHDAELHRAFIEWFATLPLWLDLDGYRAVHACWDERQLNVLKPFLTPLGGLHRSALERAMHRGTPEHEAIEVLLKGPEAKLPPGVHFFDKDEHMRHEVRLAWWRGHPSTFREAAYPMKGLDLSAIPDEPLPESAMPLISKGGPIFFGHYWLTGAPQSRAPQAVCVDYSAGKGLPLVAYRWDGEEEINDPAKFIQS